jgi:multidrug efflux pump subunit AcrA (membrane-fusion protein)
MNAATIVLVLASLAQLSDAPASDQPAREPTLAASISAKNDRQIYAEVEGLITTLPIYEGMRVTEDQVVGAIDDRTAQAALDVARIASDAADERASYNIEERYARAATEVAATDFKMSQQANLQNPGVISPIEMEKKRLEVKRAMLQTEKAQSDQRLAKLEAQVKAAEQDAAEVALKQRTLVAQFDGEIQVQLLHEGEWVNRGDPIMRVVQFDVMNVESFVNAAEFDPSELQGRPVTVVITLARGRQATVRGHVVFASQAVVESSEGYSEYLVRAEVPNQRQGDFWLIRPGLTAKMTIHVNEPVVEAATQNASLEQ